MLLYSQQEGKRCLRNVLKELPCELKGVWEKMIGWKKRLWKDYKKMLKCDFELGLIDSTMNRLREKLGKW